MVLLLEQPFTLSLVKVFPAKVSPLAEMQEGFFVSVLIAKIPPYQHNVDSGRYRNRHVLNSSCSLLPFTPASAQLFHCTAYLVT